MKRLITSLAITILSVLVMVPRVSAEHWWDIKMSSPAAVINSASFNLEYTTLSTDADDNITVKAYQNDALIGTQVTSDDFGDSGAFAITVPADGKYEYHMVATSSTDGSKTTQTETVTIDTTAPASAGFGGVVRDGNTYTVTFTAPTGSGATTARIYSSASQNFAASAGTLVGTVTLTPGETVTFSYTASDDQQRYHAVQLSDDAGNVSTISSETGVTVTQSDQDRAGLGLAAVGAAAVQALRAQGGQTTDDAATTELPDDGTEDQADDDNGSNSVWLWVGIVAAVGFGLYYWFYLSQGKVNPFKRDEE